MCSPGLFKSEAILLKVVVDVESRSSAVVLLNHLWALNRFENDIPFRIEPSFLSSTPIQSCSACPYVCMNTPVSPAQSNECDTFLTGRRYSMGATFLRTTIFQALFR